MTPSCAAAALQRQHSAPPLCCSCHAAAAKALRCRAVLQQHAADLQRHHCTPTLRCSCQRPALPLTCEENTALCGCAAAAKALCYRRCAAAATLPLPTHCTAELRCHCPARSPLRSSAALQLPTPCAAAAALQHPALLPLRCPSTTD